MTLAITIVSIVVITGIVWSLRRALPRGACPICIGVTLTWSWMLALFLLGGDVDTKLIALLMGGSVVGAMDSLATRVPRYRLLFKTGWTIAGFAAVYSLIQLWWGLFVLSIAALGIVALVFLRIGDLATDSVNKNRLEKELEECCD